jgi:dTDP-4-dehydrorhamnose reductase
MKILIIGLSGCFGTEFKNLCLKNNIKLLGFRSSKLNILNYKLLEKTIKKEKPRVVINSSAIVGINQCEEKYSNAFSVNSIGALNLAKICDKMGIILVQTSTHAVFDGKRKKSYSEEDLPRPNNVYSGTKYLSELFVSSICKKYYVIRFPTLFGKRSNNQKGLVDKGYRALKENTTLKIAADKIDSPTYAKDAAKALIEIIKKKKKFGTYHLANEGKISFYTFVKELKKILKSKSLIIKAKDKEFMSVGFKPLKTSIVSKKLKKMRNWKVALKEYVDEINQH